VTHGFAYAELFKVGYKWRQAADGSAVWRASRSSELDSRKECFEREKKVGLKKTVKKISPESKLIIVQSREKRSCRRNKLKIVCKPFQNLILFFFFRKNGFYVLDIEPRSRNEFLFQFSAPFYICSYSGDSIFPTRVARTLKFQFG
jgi:hypothetical protein